jgi:hypothetical protein
LLDEPAAGPGGDETRVLGERLRAVAGSGVTLVLIDHGVDLVVRIGQKVCVLHFGQVIAAGTPAGIRQDPGMREAHLETSRGPWADAKVRVKFGPPLGSFQAIKHICADMLVELESAHGVAAAAAEAAAHDLAELPLLAALAKWQGSDAYVHAAEQTIQVHGGIGIRGTPLAPLLPAGSVIGAVFRQFGRAPWPAGRPGAATGPGEPRFDAPLRSAVRHRPPGGAPSRPGAVGAGLIGPAVGHQAVLVSGIGRALELDPRWRGPLRAWARSVRTGTRAGRPPCAGAERQFDEAYRDPIGRPVELAG